MVQIAVLGFGTVGSGVVEVLRTNLESINKRAGKQIKIKYILDRRDFEDEEIKGLLVKDYDKILADDEVQVVVEAMGGVEPAYTFVKNALEKGKSVVTSNKELVAKHGPELLRIAKDQNINFLFEASVGGGIPIIRPLNQSLTADEIYEITGILNGTTNYILSKMATEGSEFKDVLKKAQDKGYAEANPEADVEGYDACRKIAILSSLAYGMHVDFEEIYTEGITKITKEDMVYAKELDVEIKLLATSKKQEDHVYARVSPMMVKDEHPLSTVNGVFNAILVKGNVIGDVMFYGKGAGKLPTASAVVADVVDAVKHLEHNIMSTWSKKKMQLMEIAEVPSKAFIRVAFDDANVAREEVNKLFDVKRFIELDEYKDEFAFTTASYLEKQMDEKLTALKNVPGVTEVRNRIRIED